MTRLNARGYSDKMIHNNLSEVKNDHKRTEKKKFIMWYTRTGQTIKLEDTTVQPKAAACGQSGFRISNLNLMTLNLNYAHLRFNLERLNKIQSLQSPVLCPI